METDGAEGTGCRVLAQKSTHARLSSSIHLSRQRTRLQPETTGLHNNRSLWSSAATLPEWVFYFLFCGPQSKVCKAAQITFGIFFVIVVLLMYSHAGGVFFFFFWRGAGWVAGVGFSLLFTICPLFFTAERLKMQHLCLMSIFGAKSINNTVSKINLTPNYLNKGKSFLCTQTIENSPLWAGAAPERCFSRNSDIFLRGRSRWALPELFWRSPSWNTDTQRVEQ